MHNVRNEINQKRWVTTKKFIVGDLIEINIISTHRQKGGDLTESYDKSPYTNRNVKRAK